MQDVSPVSSDELIAPTWDDGSDRMGLNDSEGFVQTGESNARGGAEEGAGEGPEGGGEENGAGSGGNDDPPVAGENGGITDPNEDPDGSGKGKGNK